MHTGQSLTGFLFEGSKVMEIFSEMVPFLTLFVCVDLGMWGFWTVWSFARSMMDLPINE
jgi:hypothetical protein